MSEVKTPFSLKWLITKRARLVGEIEKALAARDGELAQLAQEIERVNAELSHLTCRRGEYEASANQVLAVLQADLNAVDATIRLHEIGINPDLIAPIRTQEAGRLLPYGEMTRLIFECLRLAKGQPVTTTEIALYLTQEAKATLLPLDFQVFRYSVRHRLKYLCKDGSVRRAHQAKTCLEGRWLLGSSSSDQDLLSQSCSPSR